MGERTGYEPGTFCWVDLATTDPAGAKAFYGELFGWEAEDIPGADGGAYTMLRLDGDEVAALYEMEAGRRDLGVPPHWFSYVSVEDAGAAAAKARELGGTVYGGPRDALDMGRMAVVGDPTGAVVGLWQPGSFFGARRVNDPGCLTWNDLRTHQPEKAATFYAGLFGWEMIRMEEDGKLAYAVIRNAGSSNSGIMPTNGEPGGTPPHWLPYFTVPSCDEATAKAANLGGDALAGPLDMGAGRISFVTDPQGAAFALFEGETDD